MPKASYDLRDFSAGTITNGDPVDIPDGAASYSLNVSPHSGLGEVTSIVANTELISSVPHMTAMTVINGLEPDTFDLAVNIDRYFILIDDYTKVDTDVLGDFYNIIKQSQVLEDSDPSNWEKTGTNTSGGRKWAVVKTVPNYTYEISGSIDVSHNMNTTPVTIYAVPADTDNAGAPLADSLQTIAGKDQEAGGAFTCVKDNSFKHDFKASTGYTIIVLENGESSASGSATTDFLTGFKVQFSRGGWIWGDLGEELDFTSTSRGLFIASNSSAPRVQHKQRDKANNVIKQYLEKSECLPPNSSNAINNIDQMAWVLEPAFSGTHDNAAESATIMTDAGETFVVDALIGGTIFNDTDGSSGVITDNDEHTVTVAALIGGDDNSWDDADVYRISATGGRTRLMCAVYGVDKIWECVFHDDTIDYYEFLPSKTIAGLTQGVGGLLQTIEPDHVFSWDFEGYTIHKLSVESGSSDIDDGWECSVVDSYALNLDDIGECFIADVAIGICDTNKAYVLFNRLGGLKGEDIILAAIDISSSGTKSIANDGLTPLYKLNGYSHVTAYTGHKQIYRTFIIWDYKADVNPTGPVDFYWLAESEEQPPKYEDGDYAYYTVGNSVQGGTDVGWVNTDKEDICVETKAGGLAVTKHIDANHDCCWFTIEPAEESTGTKWMADSGGYQVGEQVANWLGLADNFFMLAGSTPDGWWTEQSKPQVLSSEKMMVAVVPQKIDSTDNSLQDFRLTESVIFGEEEVATYDETLAYMTSLEDMPWPTAKQDGPHIHDYWEDQNWLINDNAEGGPSRGRDDGSSRDDKRTKYPERKLNLWIATWKWHKKHKTVWGVRVSYWWWGPYNWRWSNPKTALANERDISNETWAQVQRAKGLKNNVDWRALKEALQSYKTKEDIRPLMRSVLNYLDEGKITVFEAPNQQVEVDPLMDYASAGAVLNGFKGGQPWGSWAGSQQKYDGLRAQIMKAFIAAYNKQTRAYPLDQIKHIPMVADSTMPSVWAQFQGYEDGSNNWYVLGSINDAGTFKHSEGAITSTGTGLIALGTTAITWQDRHTGTSNGVFTTQVPNKQGSITVSAENPDITEGWALYKPTTKSIQKRAASGTDGNALESILIAMYTGDLTLTQFNLATSVSNAAGGIYPEGTGYDDYGTDSIFDAGDIKVGLFLDGEAADGDSESYFKSGDTWLYNMSFLYDGYQEGPLMATPVTIGPLTANSDSIDIGVRFQLKNPRITHVQIYRKTDVTLPYRLLKSIEIDTEWDVGDAADATTVAEASDVKMHSSIDFVTKDVGQDGISYEALTGMPETISDTIVNYAESETVGNYLFACRATHPKLIDSEKMIFRSQAGMFSLFNWAQDYLGIPEAPHTLLGAHNRLYAFSNKTMFKIDPYNLVLEQEFVGMGIPGKRSATVIDGLLYLGNKNGIFIFDGHRITKISQTIDDKYLDYWTKSPNMRLTLMNDKKYNSLMVTFDNLGSMSRDNVPADALVYSIDKRKWDIWQIPRPVKAHCINENNELMVCSAASNVDSYDETAQQWKDSEGALIDNDKKYSLYTLHTDLSSNNRLEWSTKTITMNSPSRRKKLKSIKLWGKNVTIGSIETEDGHLFMSTEALARAKMPNKVDSYPYTTVPPIEADAINPGWIIWGLAECIIPSDRDHTGRYAAISNKQVSLVDETTVIWDKSEHPGISDEDWLVYQKSQCEIFGGTWVEAADGTYNTSLVMRELWKKSREGSEPYQSNNDNSYQFWRFTGDAYDSFTDFSTTFKGLKIHLHSTENYEWSESEGKAPVIEGISVTYRDKTLK